MYAEAFRSPLRDTVSNLPVSRDTLADHKDASSTWFAAPAARTLARSKTGAELLEYLRMSETPVTVLAQGKFHKRFGKGAEGMYAGGTLYMNGAHLRDPVQGALTLAHEAQHARDASREYRIGVTGYEQAERRAASTERKVTRELGRKPGTRTLNVHKDERYREALSTSPSAFKITNPTAARSTRTPEGVAVALAAGRRSGKPTPAMKREAAGSGFNDRQMTALRQAVNHRQRGIFITPRGERVMRHAGWDPGQIARVQRAAGVANDPILGKGPRFRVGGS